MSDSIERFSNRVENYVKYRPGYPPEVLQFFRDELNLQSGSVIADIGAGTGISAKVFLENGNSVFGVEPNLAMREAAIEFLRDFPNFFAIDGTAEQTNLESAAIDIIVAAQAFHWFNREIARQEFQRILKNNGFVVLMWNERQLDSTDFLRGYEQFLREFATDYNEVRHENISRQLISDFFQTEFRQATFQTSQVFEYSGLQGRLLSSSYTPTEENPKFSAMIKELKRLFTKFEKDGKIQFLYDTNIYFGQI